MIKRLTTLLCLLANVFFSHAQEIKIDHQKLAEGRKRPDSSFVDYLISLSDQYQASIEKNDSAEAYMREALEISTNLKYRKGKLETRSELADYYMTKGKLKQSLDLVLKNESDAIAAGDSTDLFRNLRVIAGIYLRIGDIKMAWNSLERRQYILDQKSIPGANDTSYYMLSQYNSLAQYYALPAVHRPDSVEYFYREMLKKGKNTSRENLWEQLGNGGLAAVLSSRKEYDSAIYYYRLATAAATVGKRADNYFGQLIGMAEAFRRWDKKDSALLYAYQVFNGASRYSFLTIVASSSSVLANIFKDKKQYDSAVKYMTIEAKYKDSVAGRETMKNIQLLTSEQQQKEQEQQREKEKAVQAYKASIKNYLFAGGILLLLFIIGLMYRANKQRARSKREIEAAYNNLKSTQAQLVQSEKMASLGELTAGIAHEIQNPLNFVNNFSDVNKELIAEMLDAIAKDDTEEIKALAKDIEENETKINHHGKRADAIVKGMLQHSSVGTGQKEPTDINKLADEYFRLSYHGLRAKDKNFNATLQTDFDPSIGNVPVIAQDLGRVLLNLFNNAFYACGERVKQKTTDDRTQTTGDSYKPTVTVSTKKTGDIIEIKVSDNGNGVPPNIAAKIFQPFFTTKPTGQGTGLGLSLSYDIIKKGHGGELTLETKEGEGSSFVIHLPIKDV